MKLAEFFAAVYPPNVGDRERIEVRAIAPGRPVSTVFSATIVDAVREATALSREANVFYGLGLRDRERGAKAHVTRVGLVGWADVDFKHFSDGAAGARARLQGFAVPPSIVVATGGGYQPLWLAREPIEPDDFLRLESVNRGLTVALAPPGKRLDAAVDVSRVFRVLGTFNHKYEPPRRVTLSGWHPERRYNLCDLEEWLPDFTANETPEQPEAALEGWDTVDVAAARAKALAQVNHLGAARLHGLLDEPDAYIGPGKRHGSSSEADFMAVRALLEAGLTDAEVLAVWRASSLGDREKMLTRGDYAARTIAAARAIAWPAEARGQNPPPFRQGAGREGTSPFTHRNGAVGGEVGVRASLPRVNAGTLREQALDPERPRLAFLPVLGAEGFLVRGLAHLLSAFPKSGKTTLLVELARTWAASGMSVLYLTEEAQNLWDERLANYPETGWEGVNLVFALGSSNAILNTIEEGDETIVVLDTLRLLGIEDENDNALLNRQVTPLIALCRSGGRTLIVAHHTRKTGGDFGAAASGGHALVGLVDVALELYRVSESSNRRRLRGWGRIVEVPELLYELAGGRLEALGSPQEVELQALRERFQAILGPDWLKTKEVVERAGEPRPSPTQALKVLNGLAREGLADRDPPIERGSQPGGTYCWRTSLTSNGSHL